MEICYKHKYMCYEPCYMKKKKKKKQKQKKNSISNMRSVQTQLSRHIAVITFDQALYHLVWYRTKWATNSVDLDPTPRPVNTIQLYQFFFAIL